jgi:hypothetical protein
MYCFWILSNKLDLKPETSFYYIMMIFLLYYKNIYRDCYVYIGIQK